MASLDFVATSGVKNLVRDLRRASEKEAVKVLRRAHREIANEIRDDARARAKTAYGKRGSYGRASRAITSRAWPDKAKVRLEPKKDPRVLGAEYGAIQYPQFRAWTGNQWIGGPPEGVGYALLPTLRDDVPKIRETYGDRIMDALAAAFPD